MSNRIVLVDPAGDVVLEGYSVFGDGASHVLDGDADDPCADTLRSATIANGEQRAA